MNIQIIRSGRKSISIEITRELNVLVRAPFYVNDRRIAEFIKEKSAWIEKHREIMKNKVEQSIDIPKLSAAEINELAVKARETIPERVEFFASVIGVDYGKITIRSQVSRWGSCSEKGNLNFNCLLMLAPAAVADYVIVHELCHRKEMNHSAKFWSEVKKVLPGYETQKAWLKKNGSALIERLE